MSERDGQKHAGEQELGFNARPGGREIQGLQFVRANAALLVVLYHSAADLAKPSYFNTSPHAGFFVRGAVGVDIFFVVSGLIIVYATLRPETLLPKLTVAQFLERRFVRIIPFLWVIVIAYAALRYVGTSKFEAGPYLSAAFLWPIGPLRPNVAWTLQHEALFYVLFAVSFLLRRRMPWVLAVWCLAPVAVWLGHLAGVWGMPSSDFFVFLFKPRNAEFGVGVIVGLIYLKYDLIGRRMRSLAVPAVGVLVATAVTFAVSTALPLVVTALTSAAVVVCGLAAPTSRSLVARVWGLLGDASYSIYLSHSFVLLIGVTGWIKVFGPSGYGWAVLVLGVGSVVAGVLTHLWVEKPVIKLSRHTASSLRATASRRRSSSRARRGGPGSSPAGW